MHLRLGLLFCINKIIKINIVESPQFRILNIKISHFFYKITNFLCNGGVFLGFVVFFSKNLLWTFFNTKWTQLQRENCWQLLNYLLFRCCWYTSDWLMQFDLVQKLNKWWQNYMQQNMFVRGRRQQWHDAFLQSVHMIHRAGKGQSFLFNHTGFYHTLHCTNKVMNFHSMH